MAVMRDNMHKMIAHGASLPSPAEPAAKPASAPADAELGRALTGSVRGMDINAGYLYGVDADIVRTGTLMVTACGRYRMVTRDEFATTRLGGRRDYQLLYVHAGYATFLKGGTERRVGAGTMVLYEPGEPQRYAYRAADGTEVYWVHFTGDRMHGLLDSFDGAGDGNAGADGRGVVHLEPSAEYARLFNRMIGELQLRRMSFGELVANDLCHLLLMVGRQVAESSGRSAMPAGMGGGMGGGMEAGGVALSDARGTEADDFAGITGVAGIGWAGAGYAGTRRLSTMVQQAVQYFHRHFAENISVSDYAREHGVSVSWFIRDFRESVGVPPMRYITDLRLNEARMLLESTVYPIAEIADMVGYDNPLYFSRLFRSRFGQPPSRYRGQ